MFGRSGEVEVHDSLCILPLNVFNEKIYIFLWFWFLILGLLNFGVILFRIVILISPRMRAYLLWLRYRLVQHEVIQTIVCQTKIGDWFLLYMLGQNIDTLIFRDIMHELARRIDHPSSSGVMKEFCEP
jgi:hypothetical protein